MANMEDLTKTQIILLTLLVSFVTSIATGIITSSLLAEAPTSVTQTINRVVEHTIEKVVPNPATPNTTSTKEVTVIKEEDTIINSIDKTAQSIVRIKSPVMQDGSQPFYALGVIVSKDGLVVSNNSGVSMNLPYSVTLPDGSTLAATVLRVEEADHLAVFKINPDATHNNNFHPVSLSKNDLKLGQSVIAVMGRDKNSVAIGRVTGVNVRTEQDAKGANISVPFSVSTDINSEGEVEGGPLLNLSGELVGIKTSNPDLLLIRGAYTTMFVMKRLVDRAQ